MPATSASSRAAARSNDPLLTPYTLKHLTLKNRIMSTAHEPNYHEDGMPKERYRLYHAEKAKGGIALTMTAGSAIVSADSPPAFGNLFAYKDEIVPWLKELADACHEHGCAVMMQITHLGRRTNWNKGDWLPVLSASMVREPAHRAFPKEMEDWDIDRIVKDYADAAERMKAGGLDGIEFECYGHLMDSFWSPATNKRTDEWGMGSLDNRLRFTFRVLEAVRKRVGPDFIVGARLVADEDWDKGLSREDGVEIARRIAASGYVDFLNLIRGHIEHDAPLQTVIPVGGMPSAPHLDFCGEVRETVKFPVFHAARIPDVATARHAIAAGKLDMVGMTRAHIADPHIVRKIMAGREADIRPCVGATYCLDRIYEGHEALCIHNPATGREATIPHVIAKAKGKKKRIVIVGAGPAGLEAARVCGERGHAVIVFEAADQPGGQLRLAARSKRRAELQGIIDWRAEQCTRLGLTFHYNTLAGADEVLAEKPDIVLIATGGLPNDPPVESGSDLIVSSWDILTGDAAPAKDVLLFDDNGGNHVGMMAAEAIADTGAKLELVSPERFFAADMGGLNHASYMRRFQECDVRITIATKLHAVARKGNRLVATLSSDYATKKTWTREVEQVVVEYGTKPLDELYFELKPRSRNHGEVDYKALIFGQPQKVVRNKDGDFQLFRIGDAVAARNIHAAMYDAVRLCKDF
jgi:2,4-dienoyl-CoA reductase-like NADH-dependent reductase (Old Yellow Enzyme family)/thioredoxin reductase